MATHPIRQRILDAITEAGGSIDSHALNQALDDVAPANRRYHAKAMSEAGLIVANGSTSDRTYSLPGVNPKRAAKKAAKQTPAAAKPPKAKRRKAPPPASEAEQEQPTPPRDPWKFAQRPQPTEAPDSAIAPAHLKRLLVLALRAPGVINDDADREALAAVAAGV